MKEIIIENEKIGEIIAKLLLDKNPKTCKAIWDILPLKISLSRWGDELYGSIPLKLEKENAQEDCDVGDIAYWIQGTGFCIMFGSTPVSKGDKPRSISPVNVFAKIEGDVSIFKQFQTFEGTVKKGK